MSTPEALRLAADLETPGRVFSCDAVAAELRRQHAEIERLTAELAEARAERSVAYLAFEQVTKERDALRAALATAPAPAPLTDAEIDAEVHPLGMAPHSVLVGPDEIRRFARAIERAHGIGTDAARAQAQKG